MPARQTFPRELRLRKSAQFERVFARRASAADDWLVVYACEGASPVSRIGLVVSRKVGNAVVRNRWKRLFREAFRRLHPQLPAPFDFVVLPRASRGPERAAPEWSLLARSLESLTRRAVRRLGKGSSQQ